MATGTAYVAEFNDPSSGKFKTNTTKDIGSDDLRDLVERTEESFFNLTDDAYAGAKGLAPGINTIANLKAIVTAGSSSVLIGVMIAFRDTGDSNNLKVYQLVTGTDAESLPDVARPNDFNASTNPKVWIYAPSGGGGGGGGTITSVNGDVGPSVVLTAADIGTTPAGGLSSTDTQAALNELDTEKAPLDSPIFTGTPSGPTASFGTSTTQFATTAFVQAALAGLLDIRGTFDASGGAYPTSASPNPGSGTAGAVLKADAWYISVGGTLPTGQVVTPGDLIFANIDTPGNTQANWSRIESNLTYVPVNKAGDTMTGNLAFGGTQKNTGLAAGSAAGDSLRYEQVYIDFTVLTDGATTTWDTLGLQNPIAKWTMGATTRTLAMTNLKSGASGLLVVKAGVSGAITVTFPAGSVTDAGSLTTYVFPDGINVFYDLSWYYDGATTTIKWLIGVSNIDTDSTFAANSDLLVPSQKAVATAIAGINSVTKIYAYQNFK